MEKLTHGAYYALKVKGGNVVAKCEIYEDVIMWAVADSIKVSGDRLIFCDFKTADIQAYEWSEIKPDIKHIDLLIDKVIEIASKTTGISKKQISGTNHTRLITNVRMCIVNLLKEVSLTPISKKFNLHRSSLVYHVQEHDGRYKYDHEYMDMYDRIKERCHDVLKNLQNKM